MVKEFALLKKISTHSVYGEKKYFKIEFILNSDAHRPEKVGDVRNGMRYVFKYNIPEENIANLGKRPDFTIFKK